MSFGSVIEAVLGLARVALASILLVGVPMADAATCGAEDIHGASSAAAVIAVDVDDGDHDSRSSGDVQHCIHGHCHHSTPFRGDESALPSIAESSIRNELLNGPIILARMSAGLERPPKA